MWKPHSLEKNKPLYLAIANALAGDIATGKMKPGQRLPPQRDLAKTIGVNLSTITRAFKECERRGLIYGTVGRGTFVSVDAGISTHVGRIDLSISSLLEMGMVLPLYAMETETIAATKKAIASQDLAPLLHYVEAAGLRSHREAGVEWVKRFGVKASPEDILICSGTTNGLTCCLMALFQPGDRIAVDALTYPGFKTLAIMLGIRVVPIAMDASGMIPEDLENACRRENISGIYLMPEVQNPTAVALSSERREEIIALIERHNLLLLEDDPYGFTNEKKSIALSARIPEQSVFFGGISKVFGPGLRISFLVVPKRLRSQLEKAVLNTVMMASPLNAAIVSYIIASESIETIIRNKRQEARYRTAMAEKSLAGFSLHTRPTGYFLWLNLPPGWTGHEFELTAREAGVRVFGAEKFAVGGSAAPAAVRISLTGPETREELARGLEILRTILVQGSPDPGAIF
ncbi:MAG: PLP-dependent aminotransferase family protein [Candidatus Ozemobacteraceae bacterium]